MANKPRWSWSNPACIQAYAQAAESSDTYHAVARKLDAQFLPSSDKFDGISVNMFAGAHRRGDLQKALRTHVPDKAASLENKFVKRATRPNKPGRVFKAAKAFKASRAGATPPKSRLVIPKKALPLSAPELEKQKERARALTPLLFQDGQPASVDTLNEWMCKYPIGEPNTPGFGYCGRGALRRGSYCADHQALMRPSPASQKLTT